MGEGGDAVVGEDYCLEVFAVFEGAVLDGQWEGVRRCGALIL